MNEFIMFLTENYLWLLAVVVVIIIIIIGFLADKKKPNKKIEIKEPQPLTNEIPTFVHDGNNSNEKTHEETFKWENMPPKSSENLTDNTQQQVNSAETNDPSTMAQQPMMNNQGIVPDNVSNVNNNMVGQPVENIQQPVTQQPMNNLSNNMNQQLQGINNMQPQQPVMPQHVNMPPMGTQQPMMNNQSTVPQPIPTVNNGMVNQAVDNMAMPQPINMTSMGTQQPVMPSPVNNVPVHEPIKVTPIPGMSGSAVSFVNGPINNNQNQQ